MFSFMPAEMGKFEIEFEELTRYLYLPIKLPKTDVRIPERLEAFSPLVDRVIKHIENVREHDYVYLSVKRSFVDAAHPSNRPGWHCDGYGTDDWNFIWADRWPTRFAVQSYRKISEDHIVSMRQFEEQTSDWVTGKENVLYWLTPTMVHTTPIIPNPGGLRTFVKISVSSHTYNLKGNSHNYLFDYDWEMFDRAVVRNNPHFAQTDYYVNSQQ